MSNTNVSVGQRMLDKVGKELGMSDCGKAWVTAALDPFHDTIIENYAGYPDNDESPSVQQVVKSSYTVNAPSGVSTNWDAHICFFPWQGQATNVVTGGSVFSSTGPYENNAGPFEIGTGAPDTFQGLMVDAVQSGTNTYLQTTTTPTCLDFVQTQTYCLNQWRLAAIGIEVINTTAELTAQGLVTSYRAPVPQRSSKSTITAVTAAGSAPVTLTYGSVECIIASTPPQTVAEALLLPGTVQWKAKDGVYLVPTLNSTNLTVGSDNTCVITNDATTGVIRGINKSAVVVNVGSVLIFAAVCPIGLNLTDFNMAGSYFTGLSNSSSLTINVIKYYERFPAPVDPLDTPLVVLAKPSCRYDPAALALYSAVIREMPVAVPQRYNGLGDWFRDAIQTAKDIVSPVLSAIPHPLAMMGAGVLNGVAGQITKKYGNEEEKSMPPPGKIYMPQGNQSQSSPSKSVVKQIASMSLKKKKKKTGAKMVVMKAPKKS